MRDVVISMRRETPSPTNSTAQNSISVNGSTNSIPPKPPTPTGSPKLPRPKTAPSSTTTADLVMENILRQNVDMGSEEDSPLSASPESLGESSNNSSPPSPVSPKGSSSPGSYQSVLRTHSLKEGSHQRNGSPHKSSIITDKTVGGKFSFRVAQTDFYSQHKSSSTSNETNTASMNSPSSQHPFKSHHPVSRSGVVVPDMSSPLHRTLISKDSVEHLAVKRESPKHVTPEKRNSLTQLSTLQDKPSPEGFTRVASARFNQNARPNRLRNVQVLPDKNLLKDKSGGSVESLQENGSLPTTSSSSNNNLHKKRADENHSDLVIISHTPRPPLKKRSVLNTATDSEDNSDTDQCGACLNSNSNSNSLPPKSQRTSSSVAAKHKSSPNKMKFFSGPTKKVECSDYADDQMDCFCDETIDVHSDSGTSPNNYESKSSASSIRLKSCGSSQDLPSDNRTVPQIRYPTARLVKQTADHQTVTKTTQQHKTSSSSSSRHNHHHNKTALHNQMKAGSHNCLCSTSSSPPPKQVTWNLRPAVRKYDNEGEDNLRGSQSATEDVDSEDIREKSSHRIKGMEKNSRTRQPRRHSIDERIQQVRSKEQNPNIQLLLIHESFLEQTSLILQHQMTLISDVKQGKRRFRDYKDLTLESLYNHFDSVQKMMDFLKRTHDRNQVSTPL